MKMNVLTGILAFLAIVNIVAVDTYLYYRIFHAPEEEAAILPGGARAVARSSAEARVSKLDSVQRKELSRIKKAFRNSTDEIVMRLNELDDEIYGLLQQAPVPEEQIDRRLKEMSELRLNKNRIAIRTMIETGTLLTREQQGELFRAIFRTRTGVSGGVVRAGEPVDTAGAGKGAPPRLK